jgi:hypothetical protein
VQKRATLFEEKFKGARVAPLVIYALILTSVLMVPAWAPAAPTDEPATATEKAAEAEPTAEAEAMDLAAQWGIEITSIRLTANDYMIDYRYRVLDADKATDLFKRQIKPYLIHQETEKVLAVPETAKLGPLRNSNIPQEGKIYWMFFGNGGDLVKAGDKVTVVIGDFRVENLVVE